MKYLDVFSMRGRSDIRPSMDGRISSGQVMTLTECEVDLAPKWPEHPTVDVHALFDRVVRLAGDANFASLVSAYALTRRPRRSGRPMPDGCGLQFPIVRAEGDR
ncbi:hypothetical protein ASD11_14940 [Aeromicrobium sp. Root495]|uniref:hypothetical protein n=1 Tax=Aeromicrobium sp. Root495 TaxID=1736550 RepID=UPI000700EBED|nr:hypothetical protein [Aeromicrobium sp. Root495]KQY55798.1 hypothetical protein ASD11_14940 [Aeromicrobium sp. Root495]